MGTKRAAIYTRISDDRRGTEAGVTRQRQDCLALVEHEGWTLVHDGTANTFTDNDASAYSGRPRPAYLRLVEAIRAGDVDVVVAWHPDRLHRAPRELEDWIELQEATKTTVRTVRAGDWDLSTPAGRMVARQIGAVARYESEHKSDRIRSAMSQRATEGRPHGALRTYGIEGTRHPDGTHTWRIVDEEAAVIRGAANRVLSGEGLLSVVRDLNERGVPTLRGKAWQRTTLRSMLISARVCGWREHTPGRDNRNRKGQWTGGEFTAPAEWPAILTKAQVERLRRVLGNPDRQRGTSSRSYLLSGGLARCVCGAPLRGRPGPYGRQYACASVRFNGNGCGRVTVKADHLEEHVIADVREALRSGDLSEALRSKGGEVANDALDAVMRLRQDLEGLADDYGSGAITREEWMAARAPLTDRLDAAKRELDRHEVADTAAMLAGGIDEWDRKWGEAQSAGAVDRQRALLRVALVSVAVGPVAVRGRNTFDPDRVSYDWRV